MREVNNLSTLGPFYVAADYCVGSCGIVWICVERWWANSTNSHFYEWNLALKENRNFKFDVQKLLCRFYAYRYISLCKYYKYG